MIHTNPFRVYSGVLALEHGILVDMLRSIQMFWKAYADLLSLNGRRESSVKDLREMMQKLGVDPKKSKAIHKDAKKTLEVITDNFERSLNNLDIMLKSLEHVKVDDETFMFKAVNELNSLYRRIGRMDHVPDYLRIPTMHQLYEMMQEIGKKQEHIWLIAKAHSRSFMKFEDLTLIRTAGESRRIRRQTIELDHIRNNIGPLRHHVERLDKLRDPAEIHRAREEKALLLHHYRMEIQDLGLIIHETDVLIRRTDSLFKNISKEARDLELRHLANLADLHDRRFKDILRKLENMTRRERNHIYSLLSRVPQPPKMEHAAVARAA